MTAEQSTDQPTTEQRDPTAEPADGHRQRPTSQAFRSFIATGWEPRVTGHPEPLPSAPYAERRRAALSRLFPGDRLVIPAGVLRTRCNDTDYRFRPHSDFAYLTGLGTDREPDSVLVMEPVGAGDAAGHRAVLYYRPRAERDSEEFYASSRYGELWVGVRQDLAEISAETGLEARHLDEATEAIVKDLGTGDDAIAVRIIRGADPSLEASLDEARRTASVEPEAGEPADAALLRALAEMRLVKDGYEVAQLGQAIEITARGFADIVRSLPAAVTGPRGERVVECAFESRARAEGNGVGYDTIAASGEHACTLHWIRNDGAVRDGDLILIDAGVEVDSLYTADVTRTLPVNGTFTDAQREVYEAVLDAADAAIAAVRPGATYKGVHEAAMAVIADRLHGWGLLPGTVEESLASEGQFHRRWMVHGTSHHLGLDVHDCSQARRERYADAVLTPGMVFTVEPGLYFRSDDLLAPARFRGIGVRIEDDVLVTEDGCENLTRALPRAASAVECWMASLR
jgi:Xaa-Pro aminopeptidase